MCDGGIGVYVFVLTGRKSTSDDVVVLIPDKVQRLGLGVNNISSSKNTVPERNERRRLVTAACNNNCHTLQSFVEV